MLGDEGGLMFALLLAVAVQSSPPPLVRTPVQEGPIRATPNPPPVVPIRPRSTPQWRFGYWQVSDYGDSTLASTTNESGSAFGMVCGTSCEWFVNMKRECKQGDPYPAMINAPSGSYPVTLRCYHYGARRIMTFKADKASADILDTEGVVGVALALEGGTFAVSRFSLVGSISAIDKGLDVIIARRNARQEGLRDFTI